MQLAPWLGGEAGPRGVRASGMCCVIPRPTRLVRARTRLSASAKRSSEAIPVRAVSLVRARTPHTPQAAALKRRRPWVARARARTSAQATDAPCPATWSRASPAHGWSSSPGPLRRPGAGELAESHPKPKVTRRSTGPRAAAEPPPWSRREDLPPAHRRSSSA